METVAKALLEAQKAIGPVRKDKSGYGYKYADLSSVMDACMEHLNAAGIVVVQAPVITDKQAAAIQTRLIHAASGQEISGTIEVPYAEQAKMSAAQCYGSAMTYARRYALVSMVGVPLEDDDGAGAGNRPKRVQEAPKPQEKVDREAEQRALRFLDKLEQDMEGTTAEETAELIRNAAPSIRRAMDYPNLQSRAADLLAVVE